MSLLLAPRHRAHRGTSAPTDTRRRWITGGEEYVYDSTRGHWFGPPRVLAYGRNGTPSDGENLRIAEVQTNASQGPVLDTSKNWTCVSIEAHTNGAFTGSIELLDGNTGTGVTVAFSTATTAADCDIDHDLTGGNEFGCAINITSGTPIRPVVLLTVRERKA